MGFIFLEALKLAPRLFWYSYARPSKLYIFLNIEKKNKSIFLFSFFFIGIFITTGLSIFHFHFYQNLIRSIFFAFAILGTLVVIIVFALAKKSEDSILSVYSWVFSFAGVLTFTIFIISIGILNVSDVFILVLVMLFLLVGTGATFESFFDVQSLTLIDLLVEISGVLLFLWAYAFFSLKFIKIFPCMNSVFLLISVTGCYFFYLCLKNDYLNDGLRKMILLFLIIIESMAFAIINWIYTNKPYELIISHLFLLMGYIFISNYDFVDKFEKNHFPLRKIFKFQSKSIIWAPICAFLLYLPVILKLFPEYHTKFIISATSLAIMPVFILYVPDYIICLPIWWFQRRYILKKCMKSKDEFLSYFQSSVLFKDEMLYFQIPGLHKIMAAMARHENIGIKETVKRINELYWFTFQQKQAQKAILTLGEEKDTAHLYLHFLLAEKNYPLVDTLAKANRMAELYLLLFENTGDLQQEKKDNYSITLAPGKFFSSRLRTKEIQQTLHWTFAERIDFLCREMEKEPRYRFNTEMTHTLRLAQKLLASGGLKDFYTVMETFGSKQGFPGEIDYFTVFENMEAQLKKIKDELLKIAAIERFETKRSFLIRQKESIEALAKTAGESFYEPFCNLWQKVLAHCAGLVEKEIKLLQGSAVLAIDLKNREILVPAEERNLYFIIHNKGRELADNVTVHLRTGIPLIDFSAGSEAKIDIIEAGTVKEIAFPIVALTPGKTTVQGTVTFSDPTREPKKLDFSFPLSLVKKRAEFKGIENPYIVGQPLRGDTSLYFGREDAFAFIDKNITASGTHHTIVCHGLRRTGKSSLLYRIETRGFTDPGLLPVTIDMQGIDDEKDFYATVSAKIREKLALTPGAPIRVDSFSRFKEFLKALEPVLGQRIMVLMVDEFEELQMRVEDRRISRTIFSHIRHLMQHEEKLTFLFCGTHKLEEMSADYWSIFFNTALYFRLSRLKDPEAVRLIKEPVKGRLDYDDLAVAQILKMTGGQPYLVQLLCRTLVNALNDTKKRNDAVIDDVDDAVEEIISGGTEHFSQQIWDDANPLERLLLSAAAEEITLRQLDFIGLESLCSRVEAAVPAVSRQHLLNALEKLVSREILEEKEIRYRFPVNLLRKWLATRFPLRKVRDIPV